MGSAKDDRTPIWALGAMSGTSLDGVDAAALRTDGHKIFDFGPAAYRQYSAAERETIFAALGLWEGEAVEHVQALIQTAHVELLQTFKGMDLIGFHGQTLAHAPNEGRSLQIGDGTALAQALKCPVVWDFRSADIELGGQGAPLAPFYHFALAKYIKAQQPVAFLNLGGVGNITFVDPIADKPEDPGAVLAFDTGPANAPINDYVQKHFGCAFDENGEIAKSGEVASGVLERFLHLPYFAKFPPKSLDRDEFSATFEWIANLKPQDAVATLTALCAATVVAALQFAPAKIGAVYVTGGGRHNPVLMSMLRAGLDCPVMQVEEVGLDGDMLEAQAFAYLAVRVLRGLPTSCPSTTGVRANVGGGIVSYP
jgi:anhydro-N-acetylmuramic acid kinase